MIELICGFLGGSFIYISFSSSENVFRLTCGYLLGFCFWWFLLDYLKADFKDNSKPTPWKGI